MKWYQLHLSTLLALMLLAGLFLWLNVRTRDISGFAGMHGQGWPSTFEVHYDDSLNHRYEWDWRALIHDAVFCALVVALAGPGSSGRREG